MIREVPIKQFNIFLFFHDLLNVLFCKCSLQTSEDTVLVFYSLCNGLSQTQLLSCLNTHIHYLVASRLTESGHTSEGFSASRSSSCHVGSQAYQMLTQGATHFQTPPPPPPPLRVQAEFISAGGRNQVSVFLLGRWLGSCSWHLEAAHGGTFPLRRLSPNMAVYSFKATWSGLPSLAKYATEMTI